MPAKRMPEARPASRRQQRQRQRQRQRKRSHDPIVTEAATASPAVSARIAIGGGGRTGKKAHLHERGVDVGDSIGVASRCPPAGGPRRRNLAISPVERPPVAP